MPRRPLPDDVRKKPIKVSLDPDLYDKAMGTTNASAWVNECCRLRVEADNKKNKKGRK